MNVIAIPRTALWENVTIGKVTMLGRDETALFQRNECTKVCSRASFSTQPSCQLHMCLPAAGNRASEFLPQRGLSLFIRRTGPMPADTTRVLGIPCASIANVGSLLAYGIARHGARCAYSCYYWAQHVPRSPEFLPLSGHSIGRGDQINLWRSVRRPKRRSILNRVTTLEIS